MSMSLKEALEKISQTAKHELEKCTDSKTLEDLRIKFLGKKGELTAILKQMGGLSNEERPIIGQLANQIRSDVETELTVKQSALKSQNDAAKLALETIDVTLPAKTQAVGKLHPLTQMRMQAEEIFHGMGFTSVEGPEVDTDHYVFEALNIAKNHPARDTQDTFYITDDIILRTQTSSVQVHIMERQQPPIRIISPGRVYRSDAVDATHSPLFHQLEGLVVDKGVTMASLKYTLELFMKRLYGSDVQIRLRPHHFPFTEPSAEVDILCFSCGGKGCPMCKGEGWIELLGAGMVHPRVLEICGIDPEIYSGFAFGMGLERLAMRQFGISDMRLLYENDLRFLSQF